MTDEISSNNHNNILSSSNDNSFDNMIDIIDSNNNNNKNNSNTVDKNITITNSNDTNNDNNNNYQTDVDENRESRPGKKSVDTVLSALDKLQNETGISNTNNNSNNNISSKLTIPPSFDEQLLLANTLTSLSRGSSPVSHSIFINKNINSNSVNNFMMGGESGAGNSPFPSMNSVIPFHTGTSLTNGNRNNSAMSSTSSVASNNSVLFPPPSPNLLFFNNNSTSTSNLGGSLPGPLGNVFPISSYNPSSTTNNNNNINSNTGSNNNGQTVGTPINNNLLLARNNIISADTPPLGTLHNIKYGNTSGKSSNPYFNNMSGSNLANPNPESVNTGTIFGNPDNSGNIKNSGGMKLSLGNLNNNNNSNTNNQFFGSFSNTTSVNNSPMPGQGFKNSSYYNNPATLTNSLYSSINNSGSTNNNNNNLLQGGMSPITGNYSGINPLFTQNSQLLANSGVSRPRSPRQVNIKLNTSKLQASQQQSSRLENLKFGSLTPTIGSSPDLSTADLDDNSFSDNDDGEENTVKNKTKVNKKPSTRKRQKTSVNSTPQEKKKSNTTTKTAATTSSGKEKSEKKKQPKVKKKKKSINDFSFITQPSTGIRYKVKLKNLIKELEPTEEIPPEDSTIQSNETFTNEQGIKQYQCHICLKIFQSGHHLTRHKTSVHSVIKSFECLRCAKQFKRKDHAWQHVCKKLSCPFQENAEENLFNLGEVCNGNEEDDDEAGGYNAQDYSNQSDQ